jgi:DNA-binding MarR family transcriptional regulator
MGKPTPRPLGRIAEELHQTRPFASAEREVAVTLLRTSDVLRHAVESALRGSGISPEQYNVLRILRGAGEDGLPTLEIAERMVGRSPNITRLIDKMAGKGLARRLAADGGDRRVVRVGATPRGRALLAELDGAVDAALAPLGSLETGDLRRLAGLLDAVRGRLAVPTVREGLASRTKSRTKGRES